MKVIPGPIYPAPDSKFYEFLCSVEHDGTKFDVGIATFRRAPMYSIRYGWEEGDIRSSDLKLLQRNILENLRILQLPNGPAMDFGDEMFSKIITAVLMLALTATWQTEEDLLDKIDARAAAEAERTKLKEEEEKKTKKEKDKNGKN